MRITLDLPKYKWEILLSHLRHYREDETVNTFCCVIEGLESDKQFPMKMYQFLSSHEDLNPLNLSDYKRHSIKKWWPWNY